MNNAEQGSRHPDQIEFAGDFNLRDITLLNHEGEPTDLRGLVQEFNIRESIFSHCLTGTLVVTDALDLIGNLPIQGTERLTFKLQTPGTSDSEDIIDCSEETGHPMHIYKLDSRQPLRDGLQMYVLYFASREFVRNLRTRVSKSYTGRLDTMVNAILGDKEGLDSRKTIITQETKNQDKIVMPNITPFQAVDMLCTRAMAAGNSNSVGYHFYESTKGFNFRSWESMCVDYRGNPRDVVQKFEYKIMQQGSETSKDAITSHMDSEYGTNYHKSNKILDEYTSVEDYKFINNFHDVATNTALGTYGHRVITHNLYNKSYRVDDYHYHKQFDETHHLDGNHPAIVDSPVDWDTTDTIPQRHKGVSDYPESRVTVQPTTQFLHGEDTGNFGTNVEDDGKFEGSRISQLNQVVAGTKLQMIIKGQTYLSAGDVIEFNVRAIDAKNLSGLYDAQYSGRYIVTDIRHRATDVDYTQHIECAKDSVFNPFFTQNKQYFYANPHTEDPTFKKTT